MVVIKFQLGNDVRRITLPEEGTTYSALLQLIERLYGPTLPLEFKLKYLDEDKDLIALTSDEELQAATAHLPTGKILRLTIIDAAAPPAPSFPEVGAQTGTLVDADNDLPHDAFCRHCGRPVQGVRYVCVNCDDSAGDGGYSLCAACEALRPHDPQHVFLKLYSAPPPGALASVLPLPNLYAPAAAVGSLDDQACPNWLRQRQPLSAVAKASNPASVSKLACRFVEDVTVSDGYRVAPGAPFVKIWRLRNTSRTTAWPEGLALAFVSGDRLAAVEAVHVLAAPPGAEVDVTVDMVSPPEVGRYVSNWRLCSPSGDFFGPQVWADIVVAEEEEEKVATPASAITGEDEQAVSPVVGKEEEVEKEEEDKQGKEELQEEEEESDLEDAWAVGSGSKVRRVAGKVLGRSSSSIETAFSARGDDVDTNDQDSVIEVAAPQQPPFTEEELLLDHQQAQEQEDTNLRGSARRLIREEEEEEDGWALVPRNELVNAVVVGVAGDEAKEGEEEAWADEIKRLLEMGVGDRAAIVRALRSTGGDPQQAVEALLGGL